MTDCPNGEMRDLLPDLLHDRLVPAERAAVESHLASCAECRAELALLSELRGTLRGAPAVDVAAIVRALPAPATRAWRPRHQWRIAAAIATLAIGGGSIAVVRHERVWRTVPVEVASSAPAAAIPVVTERSVDSVPATEPSRVAQATPRRELAVAGAVSDLSDRELAALLSDLESIQALPPVTGDVENTSLAPATAPARGAS